MASRRIVLGVGGGIAAYKAALLLRLFKEAGHDVRVVPTEAALNFVGAPTWAALSGHPVSTSVWDEVHEVPHVRIGQQADLVVVAPTTADLLARAAHGLAGDLLTNVLLTARCPVLLAPAMHTEMWTHPATVANVATLRERGVTVVEPASGRLTGADTGPGRLPEPEQLFAAALALLEGAEASRPGATAEPATTVAAHDPTAGGSVARDLAAPDLVTPDLGTSGLGAPDLAASGLGTSGLGAPDLAAPDLGTSGQGTSGQGTSGQGTSGLGTSGLGTSGLGTPDLGPYNSAGPAQRDSVASDLTTGELPGGEPTGGAMETGEQSPSTQATRADGDLAGRHVVVSAGGTREPLDPVRFLGNRSSGRQGIALAQTALERGAKVTLVAGSIEVAVPEGVDVVRVETALQMREAMNAAADGADVVVMAAAVADFRPQNVAEHKIKKSADSEDAPVITLVRNPDILAGLVVARRPGQIVVGFAAETGDESGSALQHAITKLARKGCDLLVLNDVAAGKVFGREDTEVTVLAADGTVTPVPAGSKTTVAGAIWDAVRPLLA